MRAEQGQERLRHGDLAEHVDVELPPQVVHGQELQRGGNRDARIVHEAERLVVAHGFRYCVGSAT